MVPFWHYPEVLTDARYDRFRRQTRRCADITNWQSLTLMYGPAVRCKRVSSSWR
jgi:hypothetical protein